MMLSYLTEACALLAAHSPLFPRASTILLSRAHDDNDTASKWRAACICGLFFQWVHLRVLVCYIAMRLWVCRSVCDDEERYKRKDLRHETLGRRAPIASRYFLPFLRCPLSHIPTPSSLHSHPHPLLLTSTPRLTPVSSFHSHTHTPSFMDSNLVTHSQS